MTQQSPKQQDVPHHRGFYLTRAGRWFYTYIDRGSRRFVSVPKSNARRFFATAVFVYGAKASTRVVLEQAGSPAKRFRRVFIKSKFPYLTLKPNAGAYKTLFITAGLTRHTTPRSLVIQTGTADNAASFPVCKIVPVAADSLTRALPDIQAELDEITQSGTRNRDRLGVLEQSLMALETKTNQQDLQRALIQLYCLFGVNHQSAYKRLKKWTPIEREAHGEAPIAALNSLLQTLTAPLSLGRHGYNPSFMTMDLAQVEVELKGLMDKLKTFGVEPFLNSGTLLGYFRDGRPIPYDDDFDLGILLPGATPSEIFENWRKFRRALGAEISLIDKGSFVSTKLSSGIQVDLFAAWAKEGDLYVHPYCWADVKQTALLPLKTLTIRGQDFPIPADPDAVLAVNYGPNWRVPDPFWRFDYAKCKKRFKGALKELKVIG